MPPSKGCFLCCGALTVALIGACGPPPSDLAARVGPNVITEQALAEQMEQIPPYAQISFKGPEGERKLLEKLIEQELLYLEALDQGLDRDPDVRKKLEQARRGVLVGECYNREIHTRSGIPDSRVREYYWEHRDEFRVPGALDVYHIAVATLAEAQAALDRLETEAFEDVARDVSLDQETAAGGGRVGSYGTGQALELPEPLTAVADTLQPDRVAGPIEAGEQYHLLLLRPAGQEEYKSLEEVAPLIRDRLLVADQEVASYYTEHMNEYYLPEQLNLRHVVVASEREATRLRRQVLQGKPIEDVAKQYSTDAQSARRGGQIRSYRRGGTVPGLGISPEFEEVAFATPVGEVSPVFHTEQGYHFLQVESRREARQQTLEEVKGRIRPKLVVDARTKAREGYFAKLREKFGVEILLDAAGATAEELFQKARDLQDPREKIKIYEQILEEFPTSPRAEDSKFMIGFLQAEELGDPEAAVATLRELMKDYPRSDWCDDARAMIESLESPTS